ncbi:MAG: glycine cleavage system protein GcvH [Clostridiales bacterium]|jgi:glycine cleavage system H protein|nr:glycine cleavage system protein GcvH [Clostridiales bacterium]
MSLYYAETHEWAEINGKVATVGISDFAQGELGDIVFVELPVVGDTVDAGGFLCEVESVKAVSEIYAPVAGKIIEVNEELEDAPEKINENARGAWICKIEFSTLPDGLLSEEEYLKQNS